jgi:hypothetical protein
MKLRNQNIIPPRGRSTIQINGNWELNFGVKDFRVISASIFGEDKGRKNFLKFMKNTVSNSEKIC